MRKCSCENCERPIKCKGLCEYHYNRKRLYGRLETIRREKGTFTINSHGYKVITKNGERVYSHVARAEKALKKPIPQGAIVTFIGGDRLSPETSNLVICEDKAYSEMLKTRAEAMEATGNPRMRRCCLCKEWDLPQNMYCYRSACKEGFRFKHQVNLQTCFSAPIPLHKIKIKSGGKKRHFHQHDYEPLLREINNG